MSSEFDIGINNGKFRVSVDKLDEGGLLVVKVGDDSFTIKTRLNDDGTWTLNDTSNDYVIKILKKTGSQLSVDINGEPRDIEWQKVAKTQSTTSSATAAKSSGPRIPGGVYPPMPGKITEVRVAVGDTVKSGQTVCILEAMKMFNELKAGSAGKVKQVNVEPGSAVTPNDCIVLIE
ncbi:MAG: biotin/lipoyl-containing protein [Candidatus Thorarchaeota archaeon]